MDSISDFALFRAIVEARGISAAALALQSSPPAVSRRLAALEKHLGVQLADRASRRFKLSDEGILLYQRCCSILDQVRDAEAEVASRGGAARGLLRVGTPADFGRRHVAPLLATFTALHPGLSAHLMPSDIGLEIGLDGCDLILRFGLPEDKTMLVRRIGSVPTVLCASPAYIAQHGQPNSPDDLIEHHCLRLQRRHRLQDVWQFEKDGQTVDVKVRGPLSSTDGEVLRAWAKSGAGMSLEAHWDVAADIAGSQLLALLPDYQTPPLELYAVFAPGTPVPPRIRLFVDFMIAQLKSLDAHPF